MSRRSLHQLVEPLGRLSQVLQEPEVSHPDASTGLTRGRTSRRLQEGTAGPPLPPEELARAPSPACSRADVWASPLRGQRKAGAQCELRMTVVPAFGPACGDVLRAPLTTEEPLSRGYRTGH
jgi:hypothetical protein